VGYLALGDVVVAALYETGRFGTAESLVTWGVLSAYALGIPATASSRVLSSAFYALRDTRTPAKVAYLRVAVSMS
jgi:putative peptidoglycan lipid II flippase